MKYIIFNISEIDKVNFDEVKETSKETIRLSIDGTKTFVKWDEDETPSFINMLNTIEGPYTHEEILEILQTEFWINLVDNNN